MARRERASKSILGAEVAVTGGVNADTPIQIDGSIEGDVRGTVVEINRGASVKGSIFAETVYLAGTVNGRIEAAAVTLTRHAKLEGEINCETLQINSGADVDARFAVSQPTPTSVHDHEAVALKEPDLSD